VTPRGARYWFESTGSEELELLQVAANTEQGTSGAGRLDASINKHPPRVAPK
jgi:mannose-6-phosphate isomerase-like protein (cupin superfamily)